MLYQAKSFLCTILFSSHNNPTRYCDAHFPKRKLKLSKFSFPLEVMWLRVKPEPESSSAPRAVAELTCLLSPTVEGWPAKAASPSPPKVLPIPPAHFLLEPAWPCRVKLCSRHCWDPCPHPLPSPLPCMLTCLCLRLSVATNSHFARSTWELRSSREQLSVYSRCWYLVGEYPSFCALSWGAQSTISPSWISFGCPQGWQQILYNLLTLMTPVYRVS